MAGIIDTSSDMDRYLILLRDICLTRQPYESKSRKYDSVAAISEYLKGTILHEVLVPTVSNRLACIVLDTEEMIECDENDVDNLTEEIMGLLMAISNCKERFEVFKNKERLADGLEMEVGCSVVVRLPAMSGEVSGRLRYKGPIHNRVGTHFGVELINARGKGNTNGTIHKFRYFDCQEDCGIFLALNRVMSKEYDQFRTPIPAPRRSTAHKSLRPPSRSASGSTLNHSSYKTNASYNQSTLSQPSIMEPIVGVSAEELSKLDIHIGMEVYIFTEVQGRESQESGTVKFIGRLPEELPTSDIYVGIDLANPVGNGRGVFNKRHLFKTKSNHAALVPLSGVLPASTFDDTPPLVTNGSTNNAGADQLENDFPLKDAIFFNTENRKHASTGRFGQNPDILANDGLQKPLIPEYNRRQNQNRGLPDGGPIADFDDETLSQMDIYGGASGRFTSSDHDRKPLSIQQPPYPNSVKQYGKLPRVAQVSGYEDTLGLEVGSMVEVIDGLEDLGGTVFLGPIYGVIKWIGLMPQLNTMELMAGVELEMPVTGCSDGSYNNVQYFSCLPERALFVYLKRCRKDPRFDMPDVPPQSEVVTRFSVHNFGDFEASRMPGRVAPPTKLNKEMIGKGKGIQGHHNSCYLDSTLFSMFAYSYCLDSILYRDRNSSDLHQYQKVQQVLKEDIVNPLRARNFVRADRIMVLRELLDELGSVTGLTNEEKDPEEFLQTLLNHVFKADPLFELRQGDSDHIQECYFYQIFLDKDEKMVLPSTQLLIEQSFLASDLKFREVPVCLILQMPRFGKDYKMYNRVRPSLTLDVTDMVEKLPRSCTVCGGLAEYECKQCSIERSMQEHISSYCDQCAKICHQHPMRRQHSYQKIEVCDEYRSFIAQEGEMPVERHILDLYAVVCIETSHYVSFAKCGYGRNAKWCFFDSMADRVGEQSGYNIPQVTYCEQFQEWLEMDQSKLLEMDQREMPDHMRRLLCDAYMCLYESRVMMCYT